MRNTLADVIATAVRVLDQQGLEGCSMRRVAAALDVQASALYHHVPNKQSLLALMADAIVADVLPLTEHPAHAGSGAPAAGGGADRALGEGGRPGADPDPAARARRICLALRDAMLAVRDGADVVATAAAFRLGDSVIEDRLAGLVGADGARTLLLYTFGHAQSTQTHRQAAALGALGELVASPARTGGSSARREGAATAADPAADLDASFERGLDIIIAGLSR